MAKRNQPKEPSTKKALAEEEKALKPEVGKTHGVTWYGFEIGKIYANVKVVDIKPEMERSIHFIETKKDSEGKVKLKGVYNNKGEIVGRQVDWDEENVYMMTPSDFENMIKVRPETGQILPNLG